MNNWCLFFETNGSFLCHKVTVDVSHNDCPLRLKKYLHYILQTFLRDVPIMMSGYCRILDYKEERGGGREGEETLHLHARQFMSLWL